MPTTLQPLSTETCPIASPTVSNWKDDSPSQPTQNLTHDLHNGRSANPSSFPTKQEVADAHRSDTWHFECKVCAAKNWCCCKLVASVGGRLGGWLDSSWSHTIHTTGRRWNEVRYRFSPGEGVARWVWEEENHKPEQSEMRFQHKYNSTEWSDSVVFVEFCILTMCPLWCRFLSCTLLHHMQIINASC